MFDSVAKVDQSICVISVVKMIFDLLMVVPCPLYDKRRTSFMYTMPTVNFLPYYLVAYIIEILVCNLSFTSSTVSFIQATLQFCIIKPPLAIITLILQSHGLYKDGDFG